MKIQRVRGTTDLWQYDILLFEHILDVIKKIAVNFAFNQLATPIIEYSETFHRTLGDCSDIINKETYSFLDRDKRSLTLRPEFTASVVRATIENGMLQNLPLKLFSYGPLFRHERPQKCRLRQFHQFNFEYIGATSANVDLELLLLAITIFNVIGLNNITLHLNSLGSLEDRARYKEKLLEYFSKYIDDLSQISQERLVKNPLRILDSKDQKDQQIIKDAPTISSFINADEQKKLDYIIERLESLKIDFKISPKLVRGIDYYSSFVFEFITNDLGTQGTVIAGGRYDYLIKQLGGPQVAATGFAGGFERIIALLLKKGVTLQQEKGFYLVPIGDTADNHAILLANNLRTQYNLQVDLHYGLSCKKRMQKANKSGASHVIIFGNKEIKEQNYIVKNMATGDQNIVAQYKLIEYLLSLKNK